MEQDGTRVAHDWISNSQSYHHSLRVSSIALQLLNLFSLCKSAALLESDGILLRCLPLPPSGTEILFSDNFLFIPKNEAPISLRDCVIGLIFLGDCVKTILFLRDCVNRLACVMRENIEKCAGFLEIFQRHA